MSDRTEAYADLEIGISRDDDGAYGVELRFTHPESETEIPPVRGEAVLDAAQFLGQQLDPVAYGNALAAALFDQAEIRDHYRQVMTAVEAGGLYLRLRLRLDDSAEDLQELRWELLRDPLTGDSLATSEKTLFSRFMASSDWRPRKPRPKSELSALIAVSSPSDLGEGKTYPLAEVDLEGEIDRARAALEGVRVDVADQDQPLTLDHLIDGLRAGVDVLYLACHGTLSKHGEPALYLQNADGTTAVTRGVELADRLRELRKPPRLAFLASCESAGTEAAAVPGTITAQASLAPRLAAAGVAAIVAMQGKISMETVEQMVPVFFTQLMEDGRIDRALAIARGRVRRRNDAWMPALYSRLKNCRLWSDAEDEPLLIDVTRLPSTILPRLIGRDAELALLKEAWSNPRIRVQSVVAVGGAGKTALVHHWMQGFEDDGWEARGAEAAYAWSFYSQGGSDDRQASGDAFIDTALRFFGEKDPPKTPRDRGLRLAKLVRRRRTLLILDGLEPLQHPPASAQAGIVKDPAVAALIRSLAADNPGLLVITTREPVADLESRDGRGARFHDLDQLSDEAGAALLEYLGVKAPDEKLREVAAEARGHALTLTLLGTYLRKACHGDLRGWREMPLLKQAVLVRDEHASRVMSAYVDWFGEGPERQILAVLGLFDRPADAEAMKALRAEPAIHGLTDELCGLSDPAWNVAVTTLWEARLLLEPEASPAAAGALDAHPLVREHFGLVLAGDAPDAYHAGHQRLYEHYAAATDDLPDTLDAMQPLFLAIGHGCRAGRRQEVFDEVYMRRTQRGKEWYSGHKLGAVGSSLTAIAGFFESVWDRPATELDPNVQAWLLNAAGFYLRALGRLVEAIDPTEASLEIGLAMEDWRGSAVRAGNLSELTLTVGQVDRAVEFARTSVELADRSKDLSWRTASRGKVGDALHAAGEFDDAETAFREAEALQEELQPQYPKLYSVRGNQFCDLLLSRSAPLDGSALGRCAVASAGEDAQTRCEQVQERARYMIAEHSNLGLHSVALNHLSLGCATLGLALATAGDLNDVVEPLNSAVHGLRVSNQEQSLPLGLIARATLNRFRSDVVAAEADLEEALDIAERGSMRLHECDTHLEWARLRHSVEDIDAARQHLDTARALVKSTGYRRREREVAELTRALAGSGPA